MTYRAIGYATRSAISRLRVFGVSFECRAGYRVEQVDGEVRIEAAIDSARVEVKLELSRAKDPQRRAIAAAPRAGLSGLLGDAEPRQAAVELAERIAALERRRSVLVALAPLEMRAAILERLRNAEAHVADL